jgi:hypothetical protein
LSGSDIEEVRERVLEREVVYGEMEWDGIPGGKWIFGVMVRGKIGQRVELGLRWIAIHDA